MDPWIAFPRPRQESTHLEFAMRSKHIGLRMRRGFRSAIPLSWPR
jgi:hypothetical protein